MTCNLQATLHWLELVVAIVFSQILIKTRRHLYEKKKLKWLDQVQKSNYNTLQLNNKKCKKED